MPARKTCFVVMGFGEKTDFQSNPQRVLDLNYTRDTTSGHSLSRTGTNGNSRNVDDELEALTRGPSVDDLDLDGDDEFDVPSFLK